MYIFVYFSSESVLLASDALSAQSEKWQLGMKRRRTKESNRNIILTVTQEIFSKLLQMTTNSKRVKMMTWQSTNWINMMRKIQVQILNCISCIFRPLCVFNTTCFPFSDS